MKALVLLLAFLSVTFYSCTDNNPIENEVQTSKSMSLRLALNVLKHTNKTVQTDTSETLCFEFVYPLTLSYNDGTTVTVNSQDALLTILNTETAELYIEAIAFPFQVQSNGAVVTIENEDDFIALLESCGISEPADDISTFTCFEMVYPFSVINQDGVVIVIDNEQELVDLFVSPTTENYIVDFVYPLTVTQNGETITINDMFEFTALIDACEIVGGGGCDCYTDYQPVCIDTGNGEIIEFTNMCMAECAGYTAADVVDCNTPTLGFADFLGSCFVIQYPAQVMYQGAVHTVTSDTELLQYYDASQPTPNFVYPLVVTFQGPATQTVVINSQSQLVELISSHCL